MHAHANYSPGLLRTKSADKINYIIILIINEAPYSFQYIYIYIYIYIYQCFKLKAI